VLSVLAHFSNIVRYIYSWYYARTRLVYLESVKQSVGGIIKLFLIWGSGTRIT